MPLTPTIARAIRDGLVLTGVLFAIVNLWMLTSGGGRPVDASDYWRVDPQHLYPPNDVWVTHGYVYSPAFELIAGPLSILGKAAFIAVWRGVLFVALGWLAGPFLLPMLFWIPVQSEINAGNVQILIALAVVLGFRWPATWSFVLLTKLTPGVGLLWFAIRREWRSLAIALGATAAIAALSFVLMPSAWWDWLKLLTGNPQPSVAPYYMPFWARIPFALIAVVFAAWTDRKWILVAGVALALPVYYVISSSLLVGGLPYLRRACGRVLGRWFDARAAWLETGAAGARRAATAASLVAPESVD